MDEPTVIKRYANRKLYDQSRSRYVTLEELEELIRQGRRIQVVDAVSGEDLTTQTLAQIILENERGRRPFLPASFLHELIRRGEAWQEVVQRSLQAGLAGIVENQRETERIWQDWASRAGWGPGPRTPGGETPGPASGSAPGPTSGPTPAGRRDAARDELRSEVESLKARLRDLESRL